ncbi:ATP-dependent protease ATPase subunit HslU [Sporosarcina pasteurii]|uniref:ATP-dependent protease ATPase subunit HslU n=1 Tax=Sporosarcina pasteurii TaxID=1474 RepID=A0A380BGR6_SPOPA|nr:ATP-dependent protease ATPase subunit HslU [Sporosarcina pasteurii]MDS9470573.1 ATP-dependent protease ATPase subunit HslU [Sporosarcina pasteurii]QBQ05737.1 ATP-dependent protease ATPase subunit HslU [Sporosarcina pasteurii]SUJ00720.1 ATP-dependent protease ATPase subunit ClpY [Sporosarcina pasteurii]
MANRKELTPKELTAHLDRYIIGQNNAKRAVAVAIRNRYRRSLLSDEEKNEIIPKNILMIGPTGVGKTEIARRIAKLVNAPFLKVEATKFTEVGYVGRDVESMIRDLTEAGVRIVRAEKREEVREQATKLANEKLVKLLVPEMKKQSSGQNPFEMLFGQKQEVDETDHVKEAEIRRKRSDVARSLAAGELEEHEVTVELTEQQPSLYDAFQGSGMEQMGANMQDALSSLMPKRKTKRKMKVKDARLVLEAEEADKLIDHDEIARHGIELTEQSGIIFLDEMDKIARSEGSGASADVSREGVQRDILPIVEGSTVTTKYGAVKTDFILFIAAGAFHIAKPSDIIPELQGRFPIRVELDKLSRGDFERILKEPDFSLIRQYEKMLKTENVVLDFTEEAITKIAEIAFEVNDNTENIGARRLHTIMEKLLEELSYEAADIGPATIKITPAYVDEKLQDIAKNKDLSQFIL